MGLKLLRILNAAIIIQADGQFEFHLKQTDVNQFER